MKWTERQIAGYLARHVFGKKCLLLVPNCSWPGSECDLLAVTANLRVIDVEIKVSRSDLLADPGKDKWFHRWNFKIDGPYQMTGLNGGTVTRRPRQWPLRVWKHYYCMPAEIWKPEFADKLSPVSGLLLMSANRHDGSLRISCQRPAKPCRDAERIDAEDAVNIARLASLRMWDAYDETARILRETRAIS